MELSEIPYFRPPTQRFKLGELHKEMDPNNQNDVIKPAMPLHATPGKN